MVAGNSASLRCIFPVSLFAALLLCFLPVRAAAQDQAAGQAPAITAEQFVGLSLTDLYTYLGVPLTVRAERGAEAWQDDVVLVYPQADCYVYRDRVWQAGLKAFRGIRLGDPSAVAALTLGQPAESYSDCLVFDLRAGASAAGAGWPLRLRCNLDTGGMINAIFVYRPDL